MTISNVDLINANLGNQPLPNVSKQSAGDIKLDFKSVFNDNTKVDTKSSVDSLIPEKKEVDLKAANSKMDGTSPKINDTKSSEGVKEEKVVDVKDELVKEVAKEFNVTEEELVDAMVSLGFTPADLMDPANVMQIMMQLTGSESPLEIITDADMSAMFKNVNETVSQIVKDAAGELGITEDELKGLIESIDDSDESFDVELLKSEGTVVENNVETKKDTETSEQNTDKKESDKAEVKTEHADNSVLTRLDESIRETFEVSESTDVVPVDVDDVIRQINEAVRVQMTPDSTSMELTLNPENLGRVNIQVVAKNGVITATIEATDEAVKKALETQMISLKDNLNNQGIKVDAVEVTIASRSFEGQADSEQSSNNSGQSRRGSRSISLEDDGTETTDEPETISDDSTVSYRA